MMYPDQLLMTVAELSSIVTSKLHFGSECFSDPVNGLEAVVDAARMFEEEHAGTDWDSIDYNRTIEDFAVDFIMRGLSSGLICEDI